MVGTGVTSTKSDSRFHTPMLASGTIDGIGGQDNIPMELRLRPQPNGFLHGQLVVHLSGYRATPLEGSVRAARDDRSGRPEAFLFFEGGAGAGVAATGLVFAFISFLLLGPGLRRDRPSSALIALSR